MILFKFLYQSYLIIRGIYRKEDVKIVILGFLMVALVSIGLHKLRQHNYNEFTKQQIAKTQAYVETLSRKERKGW